MKADYNELVDAWWKTSEAMDAPPGAEKVRVDWFNSVFENVLIHCGWTVVEWNETVALENNEKGSTQ